MPRQARLDAPGTLHHVMVRGIEKRKIFEDERDRKAFLDRMGEKALQTGTRIYAWSLMPNHAHLLLRSGPQGLPVFMRRVLTGYAVFFNKRHERSGHLFQNRYKSIVCEEDAYFRELVRYIHLNPLRSDLLLTMKELDSYPWTGHAVLMGNAENDWQDQEYVLGWFGRKKGEARKAYRKFLEEGLEEGRRPELSGGGLGRSQGGWTEWVMLRQAGWDDKGDQRILGRGEFVERILDAYEEKKRERWDRKDKDQEAAEFLRRFCRENNISHDALQSGGRRRAITALRLIAAQRLVHDMGLPLAEAGRLLGVTTAAVSKILRKNEK